MTLFARLVQTVARAFSDAVVDVPLQERHRTYTLRYQRDLRVGELTDRHGWRMGTWPEVDRQEAVERARAFLASRRDEQLLNPVFDRPRRQG